jgi:hypothetical protein
MGGVADLVRDEGDRGALEAGAERVEVDGVEAADDGLEGDDGVDGALLDGGEGLRLLRQPGEDGGLQLRELHAVVGAVVIGSVGIRVEHALLRDGPEEGGVGRDALVDADAGVEVRQGEEVGDAGALVAGGAALLEAGLHRLLEHLAVGRVHGAAGARAALRAASAVTAVAAAVAAGRVGLGGGAASAGARRAAVPAAGGRPREGRARGEGCRGGPPHGRGPRGAGVCMATRKGAHSKNIA